MTNEKLCVTPETLDDVLALPMSDPRRAHLETCPRCHALAASYALFLAPQEPAGSRAHADRAEAALNALRAELLGEDSASAAPATPATPRVRSGEASGWRAWFAPAMRPALAFALIAIVAGGAFLLPRGAQTPDSNVLRGSQPGAFTLHAPSAAGDGLSLAWDAMPEADAYEVVFYSASLVELDRVAAGGETRATVPGGRIPAAWAQGGTVLYRVIAKRGGDEIGKSAFAPLPKP